MLGNGGCSLVSDPSLRPLTPRSPRSLQRTPPATNSCSRWAASAARDFSSSAPSLSPRLTSPLQAWPDVSMSDYADFASGTRKDFAHSSVEGETRDSLHALRLDLQDYVDVCCNKVVASARKELQRLAEVFQQELTLADEQASARYSTVGEDVRAQKRRLAALEEDRAVVAVAQHISEKSLAICERVQMDVLGLKQSVARLESGRIGLSPSRMSPRTAGGLDAPPLVLGSPSLSPSSEVRQLRSDAPGHAEQQWGSGLKGYIASLGGSVAEGRDRVTSALVNDALARNNPTIVRDRIDSLEGELSAKISKTFALFEYLRGETSGLAEKMMHQECEQSALSSCLRSISETEKETREDCTKIRSELKLLINETACKGYREISDIVKGSQGVELEACAERAKVAEATASFCHEEIGELRSELSELQSQVLGSTTRMATLSLTAADPQWLIEVDEQLQTVRLELSEMQGEVAWMGLGLAAMSQEPTMSSLLEHTMRHPEGRSDLSRTSQNASASREAMSMVSTESHLEIESVEEEPLKKPKKKKKSLPVESPLEEAEALEEEAAEMQLEPEVMEEEEPVKKKKKKKSIVAEGALEEEAEEILEAVEEESVKKPKKKASSAVESLPVEEEPVIDEAAELASEEVEHKKKHKKKKAIEDE